MRHHLRALLCVLLLAVSAGTASPSAAADTEPVGVWPLDPEPDVVRGFEPPPDPYSAGHRGVDLAGLPGQVVRAALDGTVGFVGSIGGKPVVTVLHGGRRTTYEPVVGLVERGQPVAAGEAIGRLVVTDSHCFPAACLHWGLIRGEDDYLDPLTLVGSGPVRLLPLWRDEPAELHRARTDWIPTLSYARGWAWW
jgi:murein DD-endopeptidase MepM/ murein hydrolase activator NlpD